jgi:hypothetical protein
MFGVTWRAALVAAFSAFGTAVTLRVLKPIIDLMNHPDHYLVTSYQVLGENILLMSLLSAMLMWLIASVTGREGAGGGQMKRITYALGTTLSSSLGAMLYFRLGFPLFDLATGQFSGPFTPVVELLKAIVPPVLLMILASTWLWVVISPWQRERRRRRQQRQMVGGGGPQ